MMAVKGIAERNGLLQNLQATLNLGYTASFAGDEDHRAASDKGPIVTVAGTDVPS